MLGLGQEKGSESQAASGNSDNKEQAHVPGLSLARSGYLGRCMFSSQMQSQPQHSGFPLQPSLLELMIFRVSP